MGGHRSRLPTQVPYLWLKEPLRIGLVSLLPDRVPPRGHRRRTSLASEKRLQRGYNGRPVSTNDLSPPALCPSALLSLSHCLPIFIFKPSSKREQLSVWVTSLTMQSCLLLMWVIGMWSHALITPECQPITPPITATICLPLAPAEREANIQTFTVCHHLYPGVPILLSCLYRRLSFNACMPFGD